jgi:type III secretion protein V
MNMLSYFRANSALKENVWARYSDLGLVAGVVAIVAMMILPLPTLLLDFLVAVNIASGLMLLLLGLYIASPLEFSVFPSVLLMTTLFRLSLSISTTRMILIQAHAGHIIDTFGKLVAGGNLVVGLVVFLIITVVQFIVIAKGAERVAEVAARFSLDAMPGKQLSIDSDLRAGLIDKEEAKRRRRALELESKLHGSLDGAMKFVKGDAIAGIVIIVINLLGGLAIGVMQKGMDVGSAMSTYSILTIGEGMVAQIPALLGAIAAGLIVTRTIDEERDKHLGDAIRKQFTAKPRVLIVAGAICLLLSAVPGFPTFVFMFLALLALFAGVMLTPSLRQRIAQVPSPALRRFVEGIEGNKPVTATALPQARPAVALLLRLPAPLLVSGAAKDFQAQLEGLLEDLQLKLGMTFPRIHLHGENADALAGWELLGYEVPIAAGALPATDPYESIVAGVRRALVRHAPLFLGLQDTTNLLTRAATEMPDVVKEVLRVLPIARVAEVLRRLVAESISIRNLRDILEAISEAGQRDKEPHTLTEVARIALRRQISHQVAPQGPLAVLVLEPQLEELIRKSVRMAGGVPQLALDFTAARAVIEAISAAVGRHHPGAIMTDVDIRAHVRKLVELECFDTPVLSYHELMPTVRPDVRERIAAPARGLKLAA